ncbi:MAG: DNA mismatch repair endonuclease MutL [Chitinophagaceae bacterium]
MPDIIQLLPDNIANQIAAGEVIQRPASAVKELLENAVDAGATEIRLIVQDAGKALIQVVDNGKGMSDMDARMSFERHATSKIKRIEDLFHIRTMGFRGEALASIAAVSQVELKTRRESDESGTHIEIENSEVIKQEVCACNAGTSIAMKNLFFNVPARRNFLKSNSAELRHIIDEFIRVSLAYPAIFFSMTSGGQDVFHLEKGSLKQRIVQLLGNQYSSKLVTVQEKTDYLNIHGFVGKPETAKKTRGDQYFFVNNRFIKSAYLNHAVMSAYQQMIGSESFPLYVLVIELDPTQIDVNVHPTKQEIKFEDEKIVYAFVQAAVKHALATFSITPAMDFELDAGIQGLEALNAPFTPEKQDAAASTSLFQTFTRKHQAHVIESGKAELKHWKDFYEAPASASTSQEGAVSPANELPLSPATPFVSLLASTRTQPDSNALLQLANTYIVTPAGGGYLLIHQQAAHERILYERFSNVIRGQAMASQQSLFPATVQFSPQDAAIFGEILEDLNRFGYQLEPFGTNAYIIQGTPADIAVGNEKMAIEKLLEQYKHFSNELKFSQREKLLRSIACQHAIKPGKSLDRKEMKQLVEDLFECSIPNVTPDGQPTFIDFKKDYLERLFRK